MHFIWQDKNGMIKLDLTKSVVLYFRANASPVTIGHINAIKDILIANPNHRNIKIVVDQIAAPERHGVPRHLAVKMFREFIKYVFPDHPVFLSDGHFFRDSFSKLNGVETIVFVRGNEGENKHRVEHRFLEGHKRTLRKLRHHGIESLYFGGQRVTGMSATAFVAAIRHVRSTHDITKVIDKFLPEELPDDVARKIVDNLRKCNLH
jgi:hypothetical protein